MGCCLWKSEDAAHKAEVAAEKLSRADGAAPQPWSSEAPSMHCPSDRVHHSIVQKPPSGPPNLRCLTSPTRPRTQRV